MKQKVVTASLIVNSRKIFNGKKIFEFTSWFLKEVFPFIDTHWSLKWRTTSLGHGQPCLSPSILWWYSLSCLWTDVLFPYEMAWLIFDLEPWSLILSFVCLFRKCQLYRFYNDNWCYTFRWKSKQTSLWFSLLLLLIICYWSTIQEMPRYYSFAKIMNKLKLWVAQY